MKRRGILFLLALTSVIAGWMVLRGIRSREMRARARAEMMEIPKAIGIYRSMVRPLPASLLDLRRGRPLTQADADASIDPGVDPWGHRYILTIDGPHSYTLTCLGADGAPGGTGADEDIVLQWPRSEDPPPR